MPNEHDQLERNLTRRRPEDSWNKQLDQRIEHRLVNRPSDRVRKKNLSGHLSASACVSRLSALRRRRTERPRHKQINEGRG